jgi:flagellar hook-length control protein FliK
VPSVASEALPPTFKSAPPPPQRPSPPAGENAPPAPFESLLDDTQQAAAPPPPPSQPPPSSNTQTSASAQPSQPPAPSKDAAPAKSAGPDPATGTPAKTGTGAKPGKVDAKTIEANAANAKSGGDAKAADKTDDKTDGKIDAQAAAAAAIVPPDATKPAAVNPVAVLPVAAAPADPAQANANAGAATAPVVVAALAPATAKIATAAKAAPQAAAPKTDAQDKPQLLSAQADTDAAAGGAKIAAKPVTPAHDDAKPADTGDTQATAPTSGEHAKLDAQLAASAASPTVTAKPDGDATQQLAMNTPVQNTAPSAATDAAAPAQPLAQAQVPQAVPLAGVAIEIAGNAAAGKNHFDIRLDPPELGRIEVRLDVGRDGSITSHVIADRKDTLDLLQRDASGLQRAFEDAGLKTSDNGMQFSLRDQSGGQGQNSSNANSAAPLVVEDDTPIVPLTINYSRLADARGGLDIRV